MGLFVTAALSRGWGYDEQRHCFVGQTSVDYRDDRSLGIRVRVDVMPKVIRTTTSGRPITGIRELVEAHQREESVKTLVAYPPTPSFPEELSDSGEARHFGYGLERGTLILATTMGTVAASRFPDGRKTGFYEKILMPRQRPSYRLTFSAELKPSRSRRGPGDIREYNLPFASAGLPELGKRR